MHALCIHVFIEYALFILYYGVHSYVTCEWLEFYVNKDMFSSVQEIYIFHLQLVLVVSLAVHLKTVG